MRERLARIRRNGLRWFLSIWVMSTWLAFVLLASGMLFATYQLQVQNGELQAENERLLTNVMLELEVLSLQREVSFHRQLSKAAFADADMYELRLVQDADSPEKQRLSAQFVDQYGRFKKNALAGEYTGQVDLADQMYANLQLLRGFNIDQLKETRETANRISNASWWWGGGFLLSAGILLLWGSFELWIRIFSPVIALSRTARAIANGHTSIRVPILRDDELGVLSETFNDMANAMAEREKERMHFVATVAHDLKNPLVVIGGLAQLLNHRGENTTLTERQEWLSLISQNTRKLEENIAELSDASQVSTGKIKLSLQAVNMRQLVEDIAGSHHSFGESHSVRCEVREVMPIEADPQKIERVVVNLLSNAAKYSPKGSEISVQLHGNRRWVTLHVTDRGAGMAQPDIKKAFAPFVRLEHTKSMAQGTGLGLLSVKKIVEAHGGQVQVHSSLGKGTRVIVRLPCHRK